MTTAVYYRLQRPRIPCSLAYFGVTLLDAYSNQNGKSYY